ncbi:hypothetical protein HAHE_17120 [Haloferula helveola]|uniref:Uncharacterized protein n=2 Tax=Haloferula helveola TaxID=490095 RepID=A0ABN6H5G6_9BACT|nr:hypothetical protein HAHE_17120 [Haloferula helveola]
MAGGVWCHMWLDQPRLDCEYSNLKYERDSYESDFTLWIRADMTKEEFEKHATANGLIRINGTSLPRELRIGWMSLARDWWTPPEEFEVAYCSMENNQSDSYLAAFASGRAYIQINHN